MIRSILSLVALLFLQGCGDYDYSTSPLKGGLKSQDTDAETQYDFATVLETVLRPKCMNCHDRHGAYENYQVVKASLQSILQRVQTKNLKLFMPPQDYPQLSEDEQAMLEEWILAGAPEVKQEAIEPEVKPEPFDLIAFSEIKEKVLEPYNCVACHSHYNNYASVRESVGAIASTVANDKMPFPRRRFGSVEPVSEEDKDLLLTWINQGAPEFADSSPAALQPANLKPNWISLRNNIFGPKCVLCHNAFAPRGGKGKNMGTYEQLEEWVANQPDLFDFTEGSEEYGKFVFSMIDSPKNFNFMPIQFSTSEISIVFPPVAAEEMEVIKQWVKLKLPKDEVNQ